MITPLCNESRWLDVWAGLPSWAPPLSPLLVVSPHPDDETLAIGGLIASMRAKNVDVTLLAITDGENAYGASDSLGIVRQCEQERAAACLGISRENIVRFHFPDSSVESCEEELTRRIAGFVSPGALLVAPWNEDFHPDHKVCGRVAKRVAAKTGIALLSYFFWTWHTQEVAAVRDLPLKKFELRPEWLAAKTSALAEHRSQLRRTGEMPVLTDDLLWPARRATEVFLLS
jgi:LmbE family N-acetylglucosaminyl deacetylase